MEARGRNNCYEIKTTSNSLWSLLVKVNFSFRSGMEINIVWCLDQSECSILRTSSNLDVDPHLK